MFTSWAFEVRRRLPDAEFLRYGGHTSCVALSLDDDIAPTLVLDAGTGVRSCSSLCEGAFSGAILLSHLHWDHLHGLPFFGAADRDDARVQLLVPDPLDGEDARSVLARGMSPPHFPVRPEELRGDWRFELHEPGERHIEGFSVTTREIPHKGGRTYGFRVSDGHSILTYMPDHCPSALGPGPDGWGEYHASALELRERRRRARARRATRRRGTVRERRTSVIRRGSMPSGSLAERGREASCSFTTSPTAATMHSTRSLGVSRANRSRWRRNRWYSTFE